MDFSGRKRVLVHNIDAVKGDDLPRSVFNLTGESYRGRVAITAATITAKSDNTEAANDLIAYLLSAPEYNATSAQKPSNTHLAAGVEPAEVLPPLKALEIGTVDFDVLGGGFTYPLTVGSAVAVDLSTSTHSAAASPIR